MSEGTKNETPVQPEENFAELFESYTEGAGDTVRIGDQLQGTVISIGEKSVFVDTGTKIDGVVDRDELLDEEGNLTCAVGESLTLFVVKRTENEIVLSKAISGVGGLNLLMDAFASQVPVEGKVTATCKGGFTVQVMQRRAFCPVSQMDTHYVEDTEAFVGNTYEFLITKLEEKGRNIVVSRRTLLERQQKEAAKEFMENVAVGDILQGRVVRIKEFGAFVELVPGVEGMVHISELAWSRVARPEDVVALDDVVKVRLLGSEQLNNGQLKLSLSMKQAMGDPWDEVSERFKPGDKVVGKVMRCAPFGAFVELIPGVEGLVHISEMSYTKRVLKPEDEVSPGEAVTVTIKSIDPDKRRISLSIRETPGDPWADVADKYAKGQTVQGVIEKKEPFGYFVRLEPGITGLLPQSVLRASKHAADIEKKQVGEPITVRVEAVNPADRKISLAPGEGKETGEWKSFSRPAATSSLGNLGDLLKQAMNRKNNS
ncbi:30S ribosomal protein S1 [Desulfoplanes formicivorans]|uniref:30S ribosomal protein S1 n=1 Tax=Desulfoplanes formicivorans TaxID=1592317 RepID=A0A194AJ00_9BACT|nr:30S ribosomal protein S1 [Desulfoplanes formicivorans]GAU09210.1 30S ribosomal protein S1 [Desulfoplanes formicivorans]